MADRTKFGLHDHGDYVFIRPDAGPVDAANASIETGWLRIYSSSVPGLVSVLSAYQEEMGLAAPEETSAPEDPRERELARWAAAERILSRLEAMDRRGEDVEYLDAELAMWHGRWSKLCRALGFEKNPGEEAVMEKVETLWDIYRSYVAVADVLGLNIEPLLSSRVGSDPRKSDERHADRDLPGYEEDMTTEGKVRVDL